MMAKRNRLKRHIALKNYKWAIAHIVQNKKKQERKLTSASRSLYTLAVIFIKFRNTKNGI